MKTFKCRCSNTIFFENSLCVGCGSELGWCPGCRNMVALESVSPGQYRCSQPSCGWSLVKCDNYQTHGVCNRTISAESASPGALCDCCRYNDTIPDLSVEGNHEKWWRLEQAKRRLFYTLDQLGLPYGHEKEEFSPPLSFDFKGDVVRKSKWWWAMGKEERVFTGHAGGKITINIREADPVEREKTRVSLEEGHRTIVGHFRHEIGHYYWEILVREKCEPQCKQLFGDHDLPYSDSLERHYKEGPPDGWQIDHISAYATMHPWEDFAESFATYLNIITVLDTALDSHMPDCADPQTSEFKDMLDDYVMLGVVLNEMNRSMGLIDLVPQVIFAGPMTQKLEFIHNLVRQYSSHQID